MLACKLTGIGKLQMLEVPRPTITHPTDVLIRMQRVGVCGSDVHYYTEGKIGSQVVEFPFTIGHEGAGIVEQVGPGVKQVACGDRIAIEPAMPCGACDQCLAQRPHTCRKLRFLGCPLQAEGCLSEYLVMPESSCIRIPSNMTFDQAALSEPLAIGVYAVRMSVAMVGATVGILGAGPIGHSVLLPARTQGARRIFVTDRIEPRLQLARLAGADWAGNPDTEDVVSAIQQQEPGGLDVVFECCGQQEALDQAIALLKPGGKLLLIGIPPALERVTFRIDELRRKEICIQNVRRQNHCVQPALDLITRQAPRVDAWITHRFPFQETQAAFDLVAGYRDGVLKAMIEFA